LNHYISTLHKITPVPTLQNVYSFYDKCVISLPCLDFFFQAEDGIRDRNVTGVQTCALPIFPQSANTGLTGGSGPGAQDYDREIVIISTLRLNQIHLINDAREAVCLAGSTLYELDEALAPLGREPHSVIGSSSI